MKGSFKVKVRGQGHLTQPHCNQQVLWMCVKCVWLAWFWSKG